MEGERLLATKSHPNVPSLLGETCETVRGIQVASLRYSTWKEGLPKPVQLFASLALLPAVKQEDPLAITASSLPAAAVSACGEAGKAVLGRGGSGAAGSAPRSALHRHLRPPGPPQPVRDPAQKGRGCPGRNPQQCSPRRRTGEARTLLPTDGLGTFWKRSTPLSAAVPLQPAPGRHKNLPPRTFPVGAGSAGNSSPQESPGMPRRAAPPV
ncbi:uncharacterized protein LOC128908172 [Rissa tridactyla]|uniref:uncharacterized protein LOC128908172 n=1 Tax=Rissa tridactyla TaxID=75485 RepID=UPI0023BABAB7|nr:uncharacterized protein LOC128908172 [Rissa tridactyla]